MYSLNVPIPSEVAALARDIARELPRAHARVRGEHTMGVKRFDSDAAYSRIEARTRELLAEHSTFEARIDEVGIFENAPIGTSPVVYLAVDSPDLRDIHSQLLDAFGPVETGIEGENYRPHVTVARGGSPEMAERVLGAVDPIEWTVSELQFWDAETNKPVSTLSLTP